MNAFRRRSPSEHFALRVVKEGYYDPYAGRFLNADAYVNANGDLIGFNMYAYCSNNPVMGYDPTGYMTGVISPRYKVTALDPGSDGVGGISGGGGIPLCYLVDGLVTFIKTSAVALGIGLWTQIEGGDKHHIIHGSHGRHEEGWKNFGIDPKKPDDENWEKLLPIINEVIEQGNVYREKIVEGGNKVILYSKEFINEGRTVVVKIWEEIQTGIQKLSDAWPLK